MKIIRRRKILPYRLIVDTYTQQKITLMLTKKDYNIICDEMSGWLEKNIYFQSIDGEKISSNAIEKVHYTLSKQIYQNTKFWPFK